MTKTYPLNICIFGAASERVSNTKKKQAYAIGRLIGKKGHNLIYGAGSTGVMGEVARGYLSTNPSTKPFGSTTHFIKEVEKSFSEGTIHTVECRTMAERKELYLLADVVLVLPGGNGTADELFEFLTYKQLNFMHKSDGSPYWNGELLLLKGGVSQLIINLWEEMHKQNLAPYWQQFVTLVTVKELQEKL